MKLSKRDIYNNVITPKELKEQLHPTWQSSGNNLVLANKVVLARKGNVKQFYISLYKELFYSLDGLTYLTMSDLCGLNELINRQGWSLEEYEAYAKTQGIMCEAAPLQEETPEFSNVPFVTDIAHIREFGYPCEGKLKQKELIEYLYKINKFVGREVKHNLNDGTFNKANVHSTYVESGVNEFDSVIEALSTARDGYPLAKAYDLHRHL